MGIAFETLLNEEQYTAVTAPAGAALVLAAAGTGKTRTLVYRVAYLMEQGVSPEAILLLTFTNKAAREMLARADALVGSAVGGVWGGTFHHMANRLLRRHGPRLGYTQQFTILDRDDSRRLVTACVKDLRLVDKEFPKRDVLLGLFGAAANTGKTLEDVLDERFGEVPVDVNRPGIVKVHQAYIRRKQAQDSMDFDDMLVNCLRLLQEHEDVLAGYQHCFEHILVDEYQDTNPIQAQIVDLLGAGRGNVFVVGDDFQSIYSWRGADFRNIMSFPKRYPGCKVFKLETNYRSVPEILHVANACIAGNPNQFQKTLRPTREPYHVPAVMCVEDGRAQACQVVAILRNLRRQGYRYRDMAILYRAHFHALEMEKELLRERMQYVLTSGVRFFEQVHVKDVCAILRLLTNPADEMALRRLLEMLPGVGPRTVSKLWERLGGRYEAGNSIHRELVATGLRAAARDHWQSVASLLADYAGLEDAAAAARLMGAFVDRFYAAHAANTFDNYERRLEDVQAVATDLKGYETIQDFLAEMALLTNLDGEDEAADAGTDDSIRLSTIHQAKGLEWPVVVVLWMIDGMFPSTRSMNETADGLEEERRLFYVAVTRAKDELYLCVPEVRRKPDGGIINCDPSRFLGEIPRNHLRKQRYRY